MSNVRPMLALWVLAGAGALVLLALGAGWVAARSNVSAVASPTSFATSTATPLSPATTTPEFHYIQISASCGPYYDGDPCVNMRAGPGVTYASVGRLRTGVVLKVATTTTQDATGLSWYRVLFSIALLYPERKTSEWYVAADPVSVHLLSNVGDEVLAASTPVTTKRIVVDVSQEMLYAYDGTTLFMQEPISTGLEFTPTPRGTFRVFKKTPSRYMQGPIPGVSDQIYDLPGVPWNLYFTAGGAVIHGAYWHNHFGEPWSHGCVNLSPENAERLYAWAPLGITVTVQN